MAINVQQGLPGIVADILAEAGRPMTVAEIAAEFDRLGVQHARPTTRSAVAGALTRRKQRKGDVARVAKEMWSFLGANREVIQGAVGRERDGWPN